LHLAQCSQASTILLATTNPDTFIGLPDSEDRLGKPVLAASAIRPLFPLLWVVSVSSPAIRTLDPGGGLDVFTARKHNTTACHQYNVTDPDCA
ncbi:unnamed protein product, partial [Staurois parvus]